MIDGNRQAARAMTLTAAAASGLLILAMPLAYFTLGYLFLRGSLDAQAEVSAQEAGHLILRNPGMWAYEQVRLAELLERRTLGAGAESRRIFDAAGRVVAESDDGPVPPILARRSAVRGARGVIAEVEIGRSLRPLAARTLAALGVAVLLSGLLFLALRAIPLRAVRRAESARAESEGRYRALFESMREGFAVYRAVSDGRGHTSFEVVDANPAFATSLRLPRDQLVGRDPVSLLDGMLAPLVSRMAAVREAGHPQAFELFDPRESRAFHVSMFAPGDQLVATLIEDVTEQRRLQENLAHAQKLEAVGRMAGGVAHDFNNILTVILSCSGALADNLQGDDRAVAEEIVAAARRAVGVTRHLLAFSRKQSLHPEVLDIGELVSGLGKMIGRLIGEQVAADIVVDPDVGCVCMDPSQLEQVIVNLAVNARDAMPAGGRLTIAVRADVGGADSGSPGEGPSPRSWVVITVADTGTGMDEATRSRIFEPFFTTKPSGRGTGLGLAMVLGAVQQGGGSVTVASAPGAGTTFTIRLPRVGGPRPLPADRPEANRARARMPRVLLVDDEPQISAALRRFLEADGYSVVEAPNGTEALEAFRAAESGFDLVLTDVVMPGMSGAELGRAVQTLRPVPVLYMASYGEAAGDLMAGIARERFLEKPFPRAALLQRVRSTLDGGSSGPHTLGRPAGSRARARPVA